MYDFVVITYLIFGSIAAFCFIGETFLAYSRASDLAKVSGRRSDEVDKVEAPELLVLLVGAVLAAALWPAVLYAVVKHGFTVKQQ